MSLITDISTIITNLYPASTFILSSKFHANTSAFLTDLSELPLIILDNELPKTPSIQKNNNVLKDSKIVISFLNLDSFDNTDQQSEAIRQAMEDMADSVAVKIYQEIPVRLTGSNQTYKTTPMFHVFSSNMTGVALEMNLKYNEIVNF
jgi:hypothetical protein